MSTNRTAALRYRRRDDVIRIEADITDAELRQVIHGLYRRLPGASQQWFRDQLAAELAGDDTISDLSAKVAGRLGAPHVIDMQRRRAEEEDA